MRAETESFSCRFLFLLVAAAGLFFPQQLCAEGTAAGNTLIQSAGAKPQSMAEAYSALPADEGGVISLHYNPSSLAFLKQPEMSLTTKKGVADDYFGFFSMGLPVNPDKNSLSPWGKAAGSFFYYSAGEIELADTFGLSRTVQSQKDWGGILTYANSLGKKFSLGLNAKFLRSKMLESFSDTAFALDFGAMLRLRQIFFGVAFQNIGTKLEYYQTADSLPFTYRMSAARQTRWGSNHKTLTSIELMKRTEEGMKAHFGFEYVNRGTTAFRAGYKTGQGSVKFNLGAGLCLKRFRIDYGVEIMGETGDSHFVSLSFMLGKTQTEEED